MNEFLVDGAVRLVIEADGGLFLPEEYPRRILAHADFNAPEPPGPRAKVIGRAARRRERKP